MARGPGARAAPAQLTAVISGATGFLELCDRAFALVAEGGAVQEDILLAHVFGGVPPAALRPRLIEPLLGDPRMVRGADGRWSKASSSTSTAALTTLALVATGPMPARARLVRLVALHFEHGQEHSRFDVTVNPGKHVPRYVAERTGVEREALNDLSAFDEVVLEQLVEFVGERPILAQDARHTWEFIDVEARRLGRTLAAPPLLDLNQLADALLDLPRKPSLGVVAQRLGIGFSHIEQPDEEARVLGAIVPHLVRNTQGGDLFGVAEQRIETLLRRAETTSGLPDVPGVYVLRDEQQAVLYVGKAKRLRSRVAAYVQRPLGATRRLEGLAQTAHALETQECATDLEALVLEDREIRRHQPRFNTQLRARAPRTWLRLPVQQQAVRGRPRALVRLELATGPDDGPGDFLGPFRNERSAEATRLLARDVFGLDAARREDPFRYVELLRQAWAFLRGQPDAAVRYAQLRQAHAVDANDHRAIRKAQQVLHDVLAYAPQDLLLPADPRSSRYAVVRPGQDGIEVIVVDRAVLVGAWVLEDPDDLPPLADLQARTQPEDADVVLHWLGAQRPIARLIHLPDEATSHERIDDAMREVAMAWI